MTGRSPLPGGVGRSTVAVGTSVPRLIAGRGHEVEDEAGRVLVDLNNNFTTHVHGNAHPQIVAAATAAIERGASFGAPSGAELDHARLLVDRLPGADQVRYANSGSEAVSTALRMARAITGRDHVIALEGAYHGSAETAVCTSAKESVKRGVPEAVRSLMTAIPIDDLDALAAALDRHPASVAAILVDLAPNRPGLRPLAPEFVKAVREAADETGALVIVDEVMTFRLAVGGLQSRVELTPDLTVLGKLIGGGAPVGAVAGPVRWMKILDPFVDGHMDSSGTFTGNPVSMKAGLASLELLDEAAIERINQLGERLRRRLIEALPGDRWIVQGIGSLAKLMPAPKADGDVGDLARALWWAAYEQSVLITPDGTLSVSTPMDEQVVDRAAAGLLVAVENVEADNVPNEGGVVHA